MEKCVTHHRAAWMSASRIFLGGGGGYVTWPDVKVDTELGLNSRDDP